jgi:hypothetical protein
MSENVDNPAFLASDSMQADYFWEFLHSEREALRRRLALQVKRLTVSVTSGAPGRVGYYRNNVSTTEREIRDVNEMLAQLESRFPGLRAINREPSRAPS